MKYLHDHNLALASGGPAKKQRSDIWPWPKLVMSKAKNAICKLLQSQTPSHDDDAVAFHWCSEAARAGDPVAMNSLGILYTAGTWRRQGTIRPASN